MKNTRLMEILEDAKALIEADLVAYEGFLTEALEEQNPYISEAEKSLYKSGKKLRPVMLLLTGRMLGAFEPQESLPGKLIKAAVSIEMLHTASLIHDDIIDKAPQRRGYPSVHSARGIQEAVLIGDMQFIQSLRVFARELSTEEDIKAIRYLLDIGFDLCRGELDEIISPKTTDIDALRRMYYRTIGRKTANLFAITCEAPAIILLTGRKTQYYMNQFGLLFGKSFQIMDDLKDLICSKEESGKQACTDLLQKRFTLPIIEALCNSDEGSPMYRLYFKDDSSVQTMDEAQKQIVRSPAFIYAYNTARRQMLDAIGFLSLFPESIYREALICICQGTVE